MYVLYNTKDLYVGLAQKDILYDRGCIDRNILVSIN